MIFNVLFCLIGIVSWATHGWKFALAMMASIFFAMLSLSLLREMVFMIRYRREYIACLEAIRSNSEEVVDQVNRWTTHYYVHKSFYMSAGSDGLDCGNRFSLRDRPRRGGFGGAAMDGMIIPF